MISFFQIFTKLSSFLHFYFKSNKNTYIYINYYFVSIRCLFQALHVIICFNCLFTFLYFAILQFAYCMYLASQEMQQKICFILPTCHYVFLYPRVCCSGGLGYGFTPSVRLSVCPACGVCSVARCLFHGSYSYMAQIQPIRVRCVAYNFQVNRSKIKDTGVIQILRIGQGVS